MVVHSCLGERSHAWEDAATIFGRYKSVNKHERFGSVPFLTVGGIVLLLVMAAFPREAHAVVSASCEILIQDGDGLIPGQRPFPVAGINVEEDGTEGATPSPYPGVPGSSTLSWVEVIVATNVLDNFSSTAPTAAGVREDLKNFLDQVYHGISIWVDGTSTAEGEQGEFIYRFPQGSSDDRPLRTLRDIKPPGPPDRPADGIIDESENLLAEVYENPIRGSRGRIVNSARNPDLAAALRQGWAQAFDPPITQRDIVADFRDPSTDQLLDQIAFRFICAWPEHNTVSPNVPGMFFLAPGLGWPTDNPGGFSGTVPAHASNQYIGGPGGDEYPLFEGNDYFITIQPGILYPDTAITAVRILPILPPDPVWNYPYHLPGVETSPPPGDAFEGCEPDASLGGGALNFIVRVEPEPYRTTLQAYSPPGTYTRIRPDVPPPSSELFHQVSALPRLISMEDPAAVIAIHAHGGDPQENPIFIDRITVTFTDVGGGTQFGRTNAFVGNGDFNPWFGFDNFDRPTGFNGVEVYRDSNNDGDFDPQSDLCYVSTVVMSAYDSKDPIRTVDLYSLWKPFFYILDPGWGVPRGSRPPRDDPEWTIVLDLVQGGRAYVAPPRLPYSARVPVAMTSQNVADFALEPIPDDAAEAARPDFFVVIQADSGYTDTPGGRWVGDGTGIAYGADFRAYVKPELITDWTDPLHAFAQEAAQNQGLVDWRDYRFPGGILFSVQSPMNGGLGATLHSTMPERASPPYSAVMQTHDYVINTSSTNYFSYASRYETVPFFLFFDTPAVAGPRSQFFPLPPTFPGPWAHPPISDTGWHVTTPQLSALTLYEELNFFQDEWGHRAHAQRVDSLSKPTCMLGLNVVNTTDSVVLTFNDMKIARINCYLVSKDRFGLTGFEPSDLLPLTEDGLGNTGISLWQDGTTDAASAQWYVVVSGQSSGWFDPAQDTQVPLMIAEIGDTPVPIDMDGIPQDRGGEPDLWGYPVALQPVSALHVPNTDVTENEGDDFYIVLQTSKTLSYNDRLEVVIPYGGVVFHPTGRSSGSGTVRHHIEFYDWARWYYPNILPRLFWYSWPMPIEWGDYTDLSADDSRMFGTSQLIANVPTELHSLTVPTADTTGDGVADAQAISSNSDPTAVIGLDIATLKDNAEVYLEYLVVEFYNQGGDDNFSPSVDLLPFTTDSATGGIGLYKDNDADPRNRNGVFDPTIDIPIQFDDAPDLIGVSGEPPIQVRMVFSSPGTDGYAGTDNGPPAAEIPMEEQPDLRQRVPTTFGLDEDGEPIPGDQNYGDDFFVVIRTSDKIRQGDDFSVGIVSWGPDTPTGVDPDTFTAPPQPWQPSDEYEKFDENPYGSRGVGFIEILPAGTNPAGFDFFRTRATVDVVTDPLIGRVPPVAAFTWNQANRGLLTVQFTDQSTGEITAWLWSFGDGQTSTGRNPSHTYLLVGNYQVSLMVIGPGGTDTETKTVNVVAVPPIADFDAAGTLTVQFTDKSIGLVTSWSWSFGDGGTSALQNPTNTYAAAGDYTVSLTATGPGGSDTHTEIVRVPPGAGLTAAFTYSGTLTVQFTDQSTGEITSWSWSFGDGGTSSEQNPSHTYAQAGTYTVTLTVAGPRGSDTHSESIQVPPGGGQPPPISGGGHGGGGCFIATAAFGTAYEQHVVTLMAFRDKYLLTHAGGTWFVREYYRISPSIASFIVHHEVARTVVRQTLRPAAFAARFSLTASPMDKMTVICVVVLSAILLAQATRARRASR